MSFSQGPLISLSVKMYPLQYPSVSKNDLFPLKRTQRRSGYDFLLSNFLEGFSFSQEIGSRRSREQQEIQGWIEKWSNFWNPKHLHFPWCWQSGTGRRIGFMHSIQGRLLFLARHVEKAHLQCNGGQSILGEKWGHIYMHRNQLGVKFMNGKKMLKKIKVEKWDLLSHFPALCYNMYCLKTLAKSIDYRYY